MFWYWRNTGIYGNISEFAYVVFNKVINNIMGSNTMIKKNYVEHIPFQNELISSYTGIVCAVAAYLSKCCGSEHVCITLCCADTENEEVTWHTLLTDIEFEETFRENCIRIESLIEEQSENSKDIPKNTVCILNENIPEEQADIIATESGSVLCIQLGTDGLYKTWLMKEYNEQWQYAMNHILQIATEGIREDAPELKWITPITEEERILILGEFNATEKTYPQTTVVDMFEYQVSCHADKVAVKYDGQEITYAQLNTKVNQIAHFLRSHDIGRNDIVALLAKKSIEMICGILGIMKAGAAYVPIDVIYPENRINHILTDSGAKMCLVYDYEREWNFSIPYYDLHSAEWERFSIANPQQINKFEDLAYVIYTSGTTGMPKGVGIEHRNLVNLIYSYTDIYHMSEQDVLLQFASIAFDQSVFEIFNALLGGATLCIVPPYLIGNIRMFEKYLVENKVTWLGLTPVYLQELHPEILPQIRLIESGGAEANLEIFEKWRTRAEIYNTYGPTETTVNATTYWYKEKLENTTTVPIGKPMYNTQVYICNGMQLCGIGIPGELCIAGAGVARGYIHNETLNAQRFIPNPFGPGKMYRSGDLVKWLPDGNIEYLGRIDKQVKIRGYRIELGEIQTILLNQEGIKNGVVIARTDQQGEKFICAYYVSDMEIHIENLINSMKADLPGYMIPANFIRLEELPLTPNGKIDTDALEQYEVHQMIVANEKPRNTTEETLAALVKEVLKIPDVGIYDDFFEIGGHSIRLTKLIQRIEEVMYVHLDYRQIMKEATVEKMAQMVENTPKLASFEIVEHADTELYRLSPLQKGIYVLSEMDRNSVTYNISEKVMFEGKLDVERFSEAFSKLSNSHASLRTCFIEKDGEPYQIIAEPKDINLELKYIEIKESDVQEEFKAFIRPFSLRKAPLLRGMLAKIGEDRYMFFLDIHHIISDGISIEILLRDISRLYRGIALTYHYVQYPDYCEWACNHDVTRQKEYWLKQYQENIPQLNLPLDFVRPSIQSFEGKNIRTVIQPEVKQKILEFSRKTKATEFMIFLAALYVMLTINNRQDEIIVGSPFSGRTVKRSERMIGMFVNTLALRGTVSKEETFLDLVERVKQQSIEAYENQDYPFYELVSEVVKERDFSRNPLFDVMFAFQNFEVVELDFEDINVKRFVDNGFNNSMFDLSVDVTSVGEEYIVDWQYCTALFSDANAEYMMHHYVQLVIFLVNYPDCRLKDVEYLTPEEKQVLLEQFNTVQQPFSDDVTVVQLFENQVESTPNKIAVRMNGNTITYQELNARANQLAWKLRSMGIKPNDIVSILPQRSIQMIVAILAILKAGAAYSPIDPSYPTQRIQYIVSDSKAKLIICVNENPPEGMQIPVINLTEDISLTEKNCNLEYVNTKNDLAYIIYTSGTTGKPKGVAVAHYNLVNLVRAYTEEYHMTNEDTVLQFASIAFDQAVWDIFNILLIGGTLCLMPYDLIGNTNELEDYMEVNGVTVAALTPAFLKELHPERLPTLRMIESGGASAEINILKKWLENGKFVFNTYGPTETTVNALTYQYKGESLSRIPIGKPIQNVQTYIMNDMHMCPIGVPGELCIAGAGVAQGYLNRPELTAEKFVKNPFGEGIMYRSGDLARWLPDGNIEFLGRIDEQVKIRGFRIELGEIESVLMKQPDVIDAVVLAVKDHTEENCLCAYIVGSKTLNFEEIQNDMKQEIPQYMIPSYMIQIEKIPLTSNGKVDKNNLPAFEMKSVREYIEPRTLTECTLARIFENVLGVKKVGRNDNFFELGGHSLRATKLIYLIMENLGVSISMRDIFKYPVIHDLANCCEQSMQEQEICIPLAEPRTFYEMSSVQKRMYTLQQLDESGISNNMPELYRLFFALEPERLREAFSKLIVRHESLRTAFYVKDGVPVQSILDTVECDLEYIETKYSEPVTFANTLIRPFDLEHAPLIRIVLFRSIQDEWYLFWDMHHIISDGISATILWEELWKLYADESLPEIHLQYKDYSEWLRTRNTELQTQKKYWLEHLSGELPILDLPLDYKRNKYQIFSGSSVHIKTSHSLWEQLHRLISEVGCTEFMLMISSLSILLSKYSRQNDIIIGIPISGRVNHDTEAIVGMFVNTLALRFNPDGRKTFMEYIKEVRKNCLSAIENQEYPFDELVESLGLVRDIERNPLFDVMLVVQNEENHSFTFNGEKVIAQNIEIEHNIAKFDLTMRVVANETEKCYDIFLEYADTLFKEENMRWMLEHFICILETVAENTEQRLSDIAMAGKEEKYKILKEFNQPVVMPKQDSIIDVFYEKVQYNHGKTALIYNDVEMSYGELWKKIQDTAAFLMENGVQKGSRVAIICSRSMQMVVAMYGTLLAGAAYIPIAPDYPQERIAFMLEDSEPAIILLENHDAIFSGLEEQLLPYFVMAEIPEWQGAYPIFPPMQKNDLAYIIYTSGTTGKPKGVMIEHHGVLNLQKHFVMTYQVTDSDVILKFANAVFDASVWEINIALLMGATLLIVDEELIQQEELLKKVIQRYHVTLGAFPPNYLAQLSSETYCTMRLIVTAGSAADSELVEKINRYSDYVNEYGPTEITVSATCWKLEKEQPVPKKIPIGKPIVNKQIYILDGMELCGIGVPGELCIAGIGVARGYLGRPELTAEKFVENPFAEGRLYRSGDLARWLPDGNIEFLGRIDDQVKINGFRIELGEITSCLRRMDGIADTVVLVKHTPTSEEAICAYYVENKPLKVEEIRSFLKKELPNYMIPSYFIAVPLIPVNQSGKVDKQMLPEIQISVDTEYCAPETRIQEIMTDIFAEVLGIECIGIDDDFFQMGGDSIKSIRIASKLREKRIQVKMRDIMQLGNIREIAEIAVVENNVSYAQKEYTGIITPLYSHKMFFEQWDFEEPEYFNQALMFQIHNLDEVALCAALDAIVVHHDMLRTICRNGKMEILSSKDVKGYELYSVDLKEILPEQRKQIVEQKCTKVHKSMDLENGPLMKVILFYEENYVHLWIAVHHILIDGVSWYILQEDLELGYKQYLEQQSIQLPEKTASFQLWSESLKHYAESSDFAEELKYWREIESQLGYCSIVTEIENTEGVCNDIEFNVDSDVFEQLLSCLAGSYDMQTLLLAALNMATYRQFGLSKIAVQLESHGREEILPNLSVDRTVGWFSVAYPILFNGSEDADICIREIKETLQKIPNHGMGYGIAVSSGKISSAHTPDILFNFMNSLKENHQSLLEHSDYPIGEEVSRYNHFGNSFMWNLEEQQGYLKVVLTYDGRKIDVETAEKYCKEYQLAITNIVLAASSSNQFMLEVDEDEMSGIAELLDGVEF